LTLSTGPQTCIVRSRLSTLAALDAWVNAQPDKPSRTEALSRLIARATGGPPT
jgi:hypothetical protein